MSEDNQETNQNIVSGRVISVQVGLPQKLKTAQNRTWESAIAKAPVEGAVYLGEENFDGDYQANRKYHGGPDKAVCAYSAEHFPVWNARFDLSLPGGAFGENLTLLDLTEDTICVGDTLCIGSVILQISQPRMPCANVAKRWNQPDLPQAMMDTGYTGFYCRVLQKGELQAGQTVSVTHRIYPEWSVARTNQTLYGDAASKEEIAALRDLPLLTGEWKRALGRKLQKTD